MMTTLQQTAVVHKSSKKIYNSINHSALIGYNSGGQAATTLWRVERRSTTAPAPCCDSFAANWNVGCTYNLFCIRGSSCGQKTAEAEVIFGKGSFVSRKFARESGFKWLLSFYFFSAEVFEKYSILRNYEIGSHIKKVPFILTTHFKPIPPSTWSPQNCNNETE